MVNNYIMFYNLQGNKKLALELSENARVLSDLNEKLTTFINELCELNHYTFSFYNRSVHGDFKNIPILKSLWF